MTAELDFLIRRHRNWSGIFAALLYATTSTISVNVFQNPGGIYSGGVTGLAQLISAIVRRWFNFRLWTPFGTASGDKIFSVGMLVFLLNVPLIILAWKSIGHRFTIFTLLSVGMASIGLQLFPLHALTHDSLICGIVGSAINGFGTGFALRSNISTGGVDIIMLLIREKTGSSIGSINIAFNSVIVLTAGLLYGWNHAFISAIGIVISGRIINTQYTRQQKIQTMIITTRPNKIAKSLQHNLVHGITIIHDGEGAHDHKERAVLLTVISKAEYQVLTKTVNDIDPHAFVSSTSTTNVEGRFIDPEM